MKSRLVTVGDFMDAGQADVQTGPFGTQLSAAVYVEAGTPVINVRNIGYGKLKPEKIEYVADETRDRLGVHVLEKYDIVFGRKGAVDRHLLVADEQQGWLQGSDCIRLRFATDEVSPAYVSYVFLQDSHQEWMLTQSGNKATMASLNHDIIRRISFQLPPRQIQDAIVTLLRCYDDLIENNRRRMALLEESARQLYQEWFARLRFPGHEHSRIVDGVPEGWAKTELASLIDVKHGYAFEGIHFSDAETSRILVTPGSFAIGGGFKMDKLKYYDDEVSLDHRYVLAPMDLVVTMTDLSKQSDTLGFPAFAPRIDGLMFLHNQRIGKIVSKTGFFPKYYFYCVFCDMPYRHYVVGSATGTSVKHTSPSRILAYSPLMPRYGGLVPEFERTVEPLFQQINCLGESNQRLRVARDLLLPRLMSGEVAA